MISGKAEENGVSEKKGSGRSSAKSVFENKLLDGAAEKKLNAGKESDKKKAKVAVLYGKGNPFMDFLSDELKRRGYEVHARAIPKDKNDHVNEKDVKKTLSDLKDFSGMIAVTDYTVMQIVREITRKSPICAYGDNMMPKYLSTIEGVIGVNKPLIDGLRAEGKVPVVLETNIGDHTNFYNILSLEEVKGIDPLLATSFSDDRIEVYSGKWRARESKIFTAILNKKLGVPVVPVEDFDRSGSYWDLRDALESLKIDPEKAVILLDHHVYVRHIDERYTKVKICPCCNPGRREYKTDEHTTEALSKAIEKAMQVKKGSE